MEIKLDLYEADELDAFGDFMKAAAKARRDRQSREPKDNMLFGLEKLVGGIERETSAQWRNHYDNEVTTEKYASKTYVAVDETGPIPPSVLDEPSVQQAVKRERGKPSAGRGRRTKEEIAEDDAAEKLGEQIGGLPEEAKTMSAAEAEAQLNHAVTGPVDSAETQAADKADEKAEAAAANPDKLLTHDDLRGAMGAYVKKFGMPAAQADGPTIFNDALGAPPSGETTWKLSLVPDQQPALREALASWTKAIEANPFDREVVKAAA